MSPKSCCTAADPHAVAPSSRWQTGQTQVDHGQARGRLPHAQQEPNSTIEPRPKWAKPCAERGWQDVRAAVSSRECGRFRKVLAASCHIGAGAEAFIDVKEPSPWIVPDLPTSGDGIGISPSACPRSRGAATQEGWSA